jgi:hypothetical protein
MKVIASVAAVGTLAFLLVSAYAVAKRAVSPIEYAVSSILIVSAMATYVVTEYKGGQAAERHSDF